MIKKTSRKAKKNLRHKRVRKKVLGTTNVPRVAVFKSARHIYAQVIDDSTGSTLLQVSSLSKEVNELIKKEGNDKITKTEMANLIGKYLGELSVSKGIKKIRFDRGGYLFHGRVKSLADGLREKGLEF